MSNVATSDDDGRDEQLLRDQAGQFGALDAATVADLVARRAAPRAVEKLIEHNLTIVVEQADAHRGRGVSFGDLYQEGAVGLLDAVGAYDGRGTFRDFASLHIGLQMDSLIEATSVDRDRDQRLVEDVSVMDLAGASFHRENGREATDADFARVLGWDLERVSVARHQLELAREQNDVKTLSFIDQTDLVETLEFPEPEKDPYRRPGGAGPDD